MTKAPVDKSFEEILAEVEGLVRDLQEGEVPLAEALALYEQGHALVTEAQHRLADARQKLEVLRKDADESDPD